MSTLPRIPRKSSLPWHLLLTPDTSSDTLADTTDMVWQFHPYDISNSRCLSPVIKCTHVNLSLILALNHLHEEYEVDEFIVSIFISLEAEGYKMALPRIVSLLSQDQKSDSQRWSLTGIWAFKHVYSEFLPDVFYMTTGTVIKAKLIKQVYVHLHRH